MIAPGNRYGKPDVARPLLRYVAHSAPDATIGLLLLAELGEGVRAGVPRGIHPEPVTKVGNLHDDRLLIECTEAHAMRRVFWDVITGTKAMSRVYLGAFELYRGALEKDPQNALAYAGLADAYSGFSDWYLPPRAVMPEAKAAALNALRLDDSLSAAHNALCRRFTIKRLFSDREPSPKESSRTGGAE